MAIMERIVEITIGNNQLGFRAMSSKVGFGEKNTPMMRPNGEMEAWGSATGMGDVAIEDSFTTGLSEVAAQNTTQNLEGKYHKVRADGMAGTAARSARV